MSFPTYFAHPTAVIDDGAEVGENSKIWHFSHLMPGAIVGRQCIIGQNAFIDNNAVIGDRVKIQNNVSIYNGVIIESDVFLGPSVVFTNVINPRSFIERKDEFQETRIGRGASIGANATIVCGIRVGPYAFIGAGAVVTRNVPAYALWTGNPARPAGWVSEAGYRLEPDITGKASCPVDGSQYQLVGGELHRLL